MSTNGFITFIADGQRKSAYNHSDSYPEGLGLTVLRWLRIARDGGLEQAIDRLTVVSDDDGPSPTPEQRAALARFERPGVGGPDEHWYRLLRGTQGDPALILEAGYVVWAGEPYGWEYVIDADNQELAIPGRGLRWAWDELPDDDGFLAETGAAR